MKISPLRQFPRNRSVLITAPTKHHRMGGLHNIISGGVYFAWKNPPPTITRGSAGTAAPFNLCRHARPVVNKSIRPAARLNATTNRIGRDDHDINSTAQHWSGHDHLPSTESSIRHQPSANPSSAIRQSTALRPQPPSQSKPIRYQSPRKQGNSSKTVDAGAHKQAQGGSYRRISRHHAG